jgi:hypothetical protein
MEIACLEEVTLLLHAEGGEIEPLAKHIEEGGALGPDTRKWLADHLRGRHPKKPGIKRLWSQVEREMKVASHIRHIQDQWWIYDAINKYGLEYCKEQLADEDKYLKLRNEYREPIKENRALSIYLDAHPDMNRETIRAYLRNVKKLRRERGW